MAALNKRAAQPVFNVVCEPVAPAFGSFRMEDLTQRCQCRFPVATVSNQHQFCGRPTVKSDRNRHGSWCDEHLEVVFERKRQTGASSRSEGRR